MVIYTTKVILQISDHVMIDLAYQSAYQPTSLFKSKYLMYVQWPSSPELSVSTEQCWYVSYSNYTGENHSLHPTFLDQTNVRPNKEMGGNVA